MLKASVPTTPADVPARLETGNHSGAFHSLPQRQLGIYIAAALLLSGAFFWLYQSVFSWLWWRWNNDEYYGHGMFLPFISGYLIWRECEVLACAWREREYSVWGRLAGWSILGFGLLMQLGAAIADVNFAGAFSIPFVLLGLAWVLGGAKFGRLLVFPIMFFAAAVPLSGMLVQTLTVPLQNYAASGAGVALGLMGLPVTREGVNLYTPLYHFVVAVPCSGLKTTITLFTLAILVAHLLPDLKRQHRALLVLLSIPIALFANTLRVTAIVLIGHFWGTKAAEGFLHNFSGLFLFALSMAALLGVSRSMRAPESEPGESGQTLEEPSTPAPAWRTPYLLKPLVVVLTLLCTTRLLGHYAVAGDDVKSRDQTAIVARLQLPRTVSTSGIENSSTEIWKGQPVKVDQTVYDVLHPDAAVQMRYTLSTPRGPLVVNSIVLYSNNWKSLHSPVMCLRAGGWDISSDEKREVAGQTVNDKKIESLTINLLTGERRENNRQVANTYLAYLFADTHRSIGGWIPTAASLVGAKLLRQKSGAIEAQFAFDGRALERDGKIRPEVEALMLRVVADVKKAMAATS